MRLKIYTDGACSPNPGNGGFSFCIINRKGNHIIKSGSEKNTTNNKMELLAILESIKYVLKRVKSQRQVFVDIYTDSAYCFNAISGVWYEGWKANGWKTRSNEKVKNIEEWKEMQRILSENKNIKVNMVKVKGHSGDMYNEIVDVEAKKASKSL